MRLMIHRRNKELIESLQKREGIPEPIARKTLCDNPRRLYGLDA